MNRFSVLHFFRLLLLIHTYGELQEPLVEKHLLVMMMMPSTGAHPDLLLFLSSCFFFAKSQNIFATWLMTAANFCRYILRDLNCCSSWFYCYFLHCCEMRRAVVLKRSKKTLWKKEVEAGMNVCLHRHSFLSTLLWCMSCFLSSCLLTSCWFRCWPEKRAQAEKNSEGSVCKREVAEWLLRCDDQLCDAWVEHLIASLRPKSSSKPLMLCSLRFLSLSLFSRRRSFRLFTSETICYVMFLRCSLSHGLHSQRRLLCSNCMLSHSSWRQKEKKRLFVFCFPKDSPSSHLISAFCLLSRCFLCVWA